MTVASKDFQVFVKPIGSICNLKCQYCYYLDKRQLYPDTDSFQMSFDILEEYIIQHIEAAPEPVILFSWHGGEPTLLGLDYYRKIVEIQNKHLPPSRKIINGIQTNGTLLNEDWCRFLKNEGFILGLSLDGPKNLHDKYRLTFKNESSFDETIRGFNLLHKYNVYTEILCVVNSENVRYPLEVYRFFKKIGVKQLTFIPLVQYNPKAASKVSEISLHSKAWGEFLCTIFDEWINYDIGKIKIQIFEEAIRTAFNQEHSLCIFRPTCGDVPVIEHNGDFYSCDHFVDTKHHIGNIMKTSLVKLLNSSEQRIFGEDKLSKLSDYCRKCEARSMCNGGCPKNRFITTPNGEQGLNYLCEGYKKFFTHCQPFVSEVANIWNQQEKKWK